MGLLSLLPVSALMKLRGWNYAPFRGLSHNPDLAAKAARIALPRQVYAIFFTPRSGSSRLTDILGQTKQLGRPGECYNPAHVSTNAKVYGVKTLETYVDRLHRLRKVGDLMGFEATYDHVIMNFETEARFDALVAPTHLVWLIREDIVLQAVSVSRMRQTKVGHDTGLTEEERAKSELAFKYDASDIRQRLNAIRWREIRTEAYLARSAAPLLRLSYERLSALGPLEIARCLANHLGQKLPDDMTFKEAHRKLGTDKNLAFAERFRTENPQFVARIEAERAAMLDALPTLVPEEAS
mgnify:FL=1